MQIIPTADGLITIQQAAQLTGRSQEAVRAWIRRGYRLPSGDRVKLVPKRRDGWVILLDPVDVAKADRATDPHGRFRRFPVPLAA